MKKTRLYLIILPTFAISPLGFCDDASLEEMRQRCEEVRESKIAPMRKAAVEECVASRRSTRTRADCERLYRDFGAGGGMVAGGARTAMFNDLPECVAYRAAKDKQENNRSRR